MKLSGILFLSILLSVCVHAQPLLHGHIISGNGQPVPYATLRLVHKGIGTGANGRGEFSLKFTEEVGVDTLEVSSIGYLSRGTPLSLLTGRADVVITLELNTAPLQEVSVSYRDP